MAEENSGTKLDIFAMLTVLVVAGLVTIGTGSICLGAAAGILTDIWLKGVKV